MLYMTQSKWLLLITNLPGGNQTLRMRIWRALKAAGAASLRDGVYLLPKSDAAKRVFTEQTRELEAGAGSAHVVAFTSDSPAQQAALLALFDRTGDYREVLDHLSSLQRELPKIEEVEARRRLAALRREQSAVAAVDFFGGEARSQAETALTDLTMALDARYSPDEPRSTPRRISRLDPKDYRARTWATREHLWIDRVCSAWLIRRFIDPKAKFQWLKRVKDCPKAAVGFDFDGADFSHIGHRVTFEVLLHSFGLEGDTALLALAALVHFLDVGGVPIPEAAGLAAVVSGARALHPDDTALLSAVSPVLDSLYAAFLAPKEG
jgi:hypothetical protein